MSTLGDARSPAGHAAYSMRGQDDHWVIIQRQTFTNWANEQLKSVDMDIKDLDTDFCDGIRLCALMEVLQKRRIGRYVKKPINQHQYLDNVSLALKAIEHDNIKLVNIGNEDIVNGNRKLILGMVWSLILHYQIGKSGIPPKKLMLAWLQAVIPECGISNFSRDWNDGVALNALVEYCKPGLAPKWRSLRRADGLNNCRTAMNLAKEHFNIPLVLSPENLTNPDLDELSGMTYLSYFMKVDSPGYNATLNWVQSQVQYPQITNFQTDWNDGQALTALVKSLGGNIPPGGASDPSVVTETAMNVAEQQLSVLPVIPASEMTSGDVDHLGVMAYTAWFQHRSPSVPIRAPTPPPVIVPPPSPPVVVAPPRPVVPPSNMVTITPHQRETYPNNLVTFLLDIIDSDADKESVRIEVIGPSTKPDCTVNWHGGQGTGQFVPSEPGHHMIMVYNEGEAIQGCPVDINVRIDASHIHLTTPLQSSMSNHSSMIIGLDAAKVAQGAVRVEARSPSGRITDMSVVENQGVFTANFTPTEVGDWMVSIMYDNQHIQGSPFNVRVYDASQVKVFGLEGGTVGKMFGFSADCSNAGDGELTVDIKHNGRSVTATTTQESRGIYRIHFTPDGSGLYTIRVFFAGMEVSGSPYTLEIVDTSMVSAKGEGLSSVEINRKASFLVETHGASGGNIRATVTNANGSLVPCDVQNNGNGTFTVEYVPSIVGEHHIDVTYYDKPIIGSPFTVSAFDWRRITVENLSNSSMMGRMVEFDIDTSHSGRGDLEIMVNDGTIPCSVQNRGNRRFHAAFTPKESIPHYIQMRFQGKDVPGSPWTVDVRGITKVTVAGPGLDLVPIGRQTHFEARAIGSGTFAAHSLTASITGPTRKSVPVQIGNNFNGTYRLDYTPLEVGAHTIEVMYEGMPIDNSPFTSRAYHAPAISVSNIQPGIVGRQVEFNIDVTQAGEGQLEISVNNGTVPNSVKNLQKGVYMVRFVPRELRSHLIEIKFNGELLPRCPITVPIMDASRVTVQGDGIKQVAVNRQSYFHVNTKSAGDADLSVRVTAPSGVEVANNLKAVEDGYEVSYNATEVGNHRIDIEYADVIIPGSPFWVKTFDPTKVMVTGVKDGVVGKQSSFVVDVNHAGEGNMEISIRDSEQVVPNSVRQLSRGKFDVLYTPTNSGEHQANVTFNSQHVSGSPYGFRVVDASKVTASGDGLKLAPCNKYSSFRISAQGAREADLDVKITNAAGRVIPMRMSEVGIGTFNVEWLPTDTGDHKIDVKYLDMPIKDSPFSCQAWDHNQVVVSGISPGRVAKASYFNIDASRAGRGNLEIIVSVNGENVPNFVKQVPNVARFEVSFTPQGSEAHNISVKFNNESVPGSPFICSIVDGAKAQATGGGLKQIPANRPTQFNVNTFNVGEADIYCTISSPSNVTIPYRISGSHLTSFNIEYTPTEVGRHRIDVKYADADIMGSPFYPEVFDASLVKVGNVPHGVIGQWVYFDVDCSLAGEGTLTVDVHGVTTQPMTDVKPKGSNQFTVGFVPKETSPQTIHIVFNQEPVPGSPFTAKVLDTSSVTLLADMARAFPVHRPVAFELETGGITEAPVDVIVSGPTGKQLTCNLTPVQSANRRMIEFTPLEVGGHTLSVNFAGQPIKGSPFTCYSYDASRVRIVDITSPAKPNEPLSFTVDTSSAGSGDIDVEVAFDSQLQQLQRHKLDDYRHQFTFTPPIAATYSLSVMFNYEKVPDTPMPLPVADNFGTLSLGADSQKIAAVNEPSWSSLLTQGSSIEMTEVVSNVTAPNGEQVPAKIVQQPDGDYKVEYASKYTGRHTVEILYAGQAIMGSPFYVEIYDPKKIRVEGVTTAGVGEQVSFDIIRHEAGKADLGLTITSPSGRDVPFEITPNQHGEHVTYVAQEGGSHQIYLTYGGLEVAGSPFQQIIGDSASIEASGDGLIRAEQDKTATFFVNTGGAKGDLFVQVDGPNSIARCKIEPDRTTTGRYIVTYTPVEVGMYTVTIKWNDREVASSPFRVGVVDAAKVNVIGGWHSLVDTSNRMTLVAGHQKRMEFDVTDAGPGVLTAAVHGPYGAVQVDLQQKGNIVTVAFTPTTEGEHQVSLWWSEVALPRSPLVGIVGAGGAQRSMNGSMRSEQHVMSGQMSMDTIRVEKVILTGSGLAVAKVKEMAEFVIDGTDAGPGQPDVKLTGVKQDIDIETTPLGGNKYRCTYVPNLPGGYLLNIMWSDRQVRGSPYKVTVTDQCDASKVVCSGEGLTQGIVGKEIKSIIDTRRAGPGELTAHCMGPSLLAFCELYNHHDGTFTLNVKPQEPGRHMLEVKYGGIHVPNSPFELHVQGAPDASKVRVAGPGIDHGILARYHSRFTVETRGAGAGQLTVRIRGPKAAFRVEMQRQSQKDRTILCRYDPTEVGDYIIYVKWSGQHVPGSPFHVHIFDTEEELQNLLMSNPQGLAHPGTLGSKGSWAAEI